MKKIKGTLNLTRLKELVTLSGWYETISGNWQYIGFDNQGFTFVQYGLEFSEILEESQGRELTEYLVGNRDREELNWLIV